MEGLGKVVSNAGISGRHEITKSMRRTPSIGQDIEAGDVDEVQIPGTKNAFQKVFLDTPSQCSNVVKKLSKQRS